MHSEVVTSSWLALPSGSQRSGRASRSGSQFQPRTQMAKASCTVRLRPFKQQWAQTRLTSFRWVARGTKPIHPGLLSDETTAGGIL